MKVFAVLLAMLIAFGVAVLVSGMFFFKSERVVSPPEYGSAIETPRPIPRESLLYSEPQRYGEPAMVLHSAPKWLGVIVVMLFVMSVAFVALVVVVMRKGLTRRQESSAITAQSPSNADVLRELCELQEKMIARVESLETILTSK